MRAPDLLTVIRLITLLHHLDSAGGTVGVGGYLDGHATGLSHFLACHVEVAHCGNTLAGIHLIHTSGLVKHFKVNDV